MSMVPQILLDIAGLAFYITLFWTIVQYLRLRETVKAEHNLRFVALTEKFNNLEKLFIQYEDLSSLAREVFHKSGYPDDELITAMSPFTSSKRKHELEFHACVLMIQLMEDVWCVHDLSNEKNYSNPKMSGWMTLFHDWYNSSIFKNYFEKMKYLYSRPFIDFIENTVKNFKPERDISVVSNI